LNYIVPHFVHVLADGLIAREGGKELALELESKDTTGSELLMVEKERARRRTKEWFTELVKSENSYQAAYRSVRELSPTVAWLELVRSSAMDRFEQLGFPPVTEEDWKYTNLATLAKEEFVPVTSVSADAP
jgi:hypothetical protein